MRILLDEDLPRRLAALLVGHDVSTVLRSGWAGIKNGKLLGLAAAEFDVLLTMDQNLEFQQDLEIDPEIDDAWAAEVQRRNADVESGAVSLVPGPETLAKLKALLALNVDI